MKQISIQITDETARQMEQLARRWGLPRERHNTPVIERAIATIYMLEIGYEDYFQRLNQLKEEGDKGKSIMMTTTAAFDKQIPLFLRNLDVALRSGRNVKQAFEMIAKDMPAPASNEAQSVVDEWNAGKEDTQILENWLRRTPSHDLDLVIAAMRVQQEVEGNLADILQLLAQIMEKRALPESD